MINSREKAFGNISKMIALSRYEIEQRQLIGEYSLNIHGEYFLRDLFNSIYQTHFENANFASMNTASIDLIDRTNKMAYQITTTRTKEKIEKTLKVLKTPEYNGYGIRIYYLLDKSKPQKDTVSDLQTKYGINVLDILFDYTDLLKDINNLETPKLIELNNVYFQNIKQKYTDEITLDLVIKHLIQNHKKVHKAYNDDFGAIDTNEKILLNALNARISSHINSGLDYRDIIVDIENEDNLVSNLRDLVVNDLYFSILFNQLRSKVSQTIFENYDLSQLHNLAKEQGLDFNKIIYQLHEKIEDFVEIKDYNSTQISWIIIAFFFELCDVGVKQ